MRLHFGLSDLRKRASGQYLISSLDNCFGQSDLIFFFHCLLKYDKNFCLRSATESAVKCSPNSYAVDITFTNTAYDAVAVAQISLCNLPLKVVNELKYNSGVRSFMLLKSNMKYILWKLIMGFLFCS